MAALGFIENLPGGGEENKPAENQKIAENVERPEVGIAAPPEIPMLADFEDCAALVVPTKAIAAAARINEVRFIKSRAPVELFAGSLLLPMSRSWYRCGWQLLHRQALVRHNCFYPSNLG